LARTLAPAVSEPTVDPDAPSSFQNPEPESRDAEIDREESEVPPRKKLRTDVKDLSGRVDAVEKTCAKVKRDNTATSAKLARLNDCVSKLASDRENDNAAIRRDLDDIRSKFSSVTGLCHAFDKIFDYRDVN
jgi:septal ring factor EnvC (AmiA/AmiB activator)